MKSFSVYSDASFNGQLQLAVSGVLILDDAEINSPSSDCERLVHIQQFKEINNIRAELRGILFAFEEINRRLGEIRIPASKYIKINLYTDCQTVSNLLERRARLESLNFKNKKNVTLANADLYKVFYQYNDQFNSNIIWLKGHVSVARRAQNNHYFGLVDKMVRCRLRASLRAVNCSN